MRVAPFVVVGAAVRAPMYYGNSGHTAIFLTTRSLF
jgi:hypothetical protein